MAPNDDFITLFRDWVWLPLLGIIGWAWNRNQVEHDQLWAAQEKLRSESSLGHSTLNDRLMEHVDERFEDSRRDAAKRMDKMDNYISKLFEHSEKDRKDFHDQLTQHREDSFKRHIELLNAINGKADK